MTHVLARVVYTLSIWMTVVILIARSTEYLDAISSRVLGGALLVIAYGIARKLEQ